MTRNSDHIELNETEVELIAALADHSSPENAEMSLIEAGDDLYSAFCDYGKTKGQIEALTNYANASNAYRGGVIRAKQMRPADVQIDAAYANGVRACLARLAHLRKPEDDAAWNDCESMWRNRVAERHAALTSPKCGDGA